MSVTDQHVPTPPRAERPKVTLIPWDPESPEHYERLRLQRVACGWKADKIEYWSKCQREGVMSIHWIVISPEDTRRSAWIAKHIEAYRSETTPLEDSAKAIGGHPRDDSSSRSEGSFIPLGHISIDTISSTFLPSLELANPSDHKFHISAFYVSRALHNSGIGSVAVGAAESMAVTVLGAKILTLDTLDKRALLEDDEGGIPGVKRNMIAVNGSVPKFSTQEWYERMGYRVFNWINEFDERSSYILKMKDGEVVGCAPSVWLEKVLEG